MKVIKKFDRYISALFILTIVVISATSYFTFENVIRSHIKHQQDATFPLFSLITNEVIRPLSIASFMANDIYLIEQAEHPEKFNEALTNQFLHRLSMQYNMVTFVALEKQGFMFDSTGKKINLIDEDAEWYQRIKDLPADQFADFGNSDDPHLYFDMRIKSKSDEFLGFVGVGIDLDHFAKKFREYNERFGIEVLFVDELGNITLTSNHLMKTESHHRRDEVIHINSQPWYSDFNERSNGENSTSNVRIKSADLGQGNLVVSSIHIPEVGWTVYVLSLPENQQSSYWQQFIVKLFTIALVALVLYLIFTFVIGYFKSNVIEDSERDFLTQLPNRANITWRFQQLKEEYYSACVVIADIDHFKSFNDNHGHLTGDKVLKQVADKMSKNLRGIDLVGRWGGEEFIMILPDTSLSQANSIVERLRKEIEESNFESVLTEEQLKLTVSFGISLCELETNDLDDAISEADSALYKAKASGRNKVVIQGID